MPMTFSCSFGVADGCVAGFGGGRPSMPYRNQSNAPVHVGLKSGERVRRWRYGVVATDPRSSLAR